MFTVQNAQKQKAHFSSFWHLFFFWCFWACHWHLRYCHVASPLKISPTHPMFETTTRREIPCAPFTSNSFGQSRVSSSSWPFSAVVCESFVFAQSCIILLQRRAEFVVFLCVFVCVSTSIRGVLLLLSFLSPVESLLFSSYWFSRIIARLHNYHCNRWLGISHARKARRLAAVVREPLEWSTKSTSFFVCAAEQFRRDQPSNRPFSGLSK